MSVETTYCDHGLLLTWYCYKCEEERESVDKTLEKMHASALTDSDTVEVKKRVFETGASRDVDTDKLDYEGFLDPMVLQCFAEYMHKNRFMKDGSMRDSDNWQKGIPKDAYVKSGTRHHIDWWQIHRGHIARESIKDALCGIIFNAQGYLSEVLKEEEKHERHNEAE
jgi:hypothetical protein